MARVTVEQSEDRRGGVDHGQQAPVRKGGHGDLDHVLDRFRGVEPVADGARGGGQELEPPFGGGIVFGVIRDRGRVRIDLIAATPEA